MQHLSTQAQRDSMDVASPAQLYLASYLHKTIQSAFVELHTPHYCSLVHHTGPHHVHRVGGNGSSQPTRKTGTKYQTIREAAADPAIPGLDLVT